MSHSQGVCTYFTRNKSKALFVAWITSSISRSCHPFDHGWLRCRSTPDKVCVIVKAFPNCIVTLKLSCLVCKYLDIFPSKSIKEILKAFCYRTSICLFFWLFWRHWFQYLFFLVSTTWGSSLHHTWETVPFTVFISFFSFLEYTQGATLGLCDS